MSYAQVVKCENIKKVDILHNNDVGLQTGASADKQAYNTRVYK